jgi:hypothetical protein
MKRAAAMAALQDGIAAAREQGRRVRFMTVTDGKGDLDFAGFYRAWSRKLRPKLRREGKLGEYACALEIQPDSGRLHGHFLLHDSDAGGGYIPQRRLAKWAQAAGLGEVLDIREVRDIPAREARLSAYFTKGLERVATAEAGQVGAYMAKAQAIEALSEKSGARLRPFRVSAGWATKLTEAHEKLRAEWYGEAGDAGPWDVVGEDRVEPFLRTERDHQAEVRNGRVTLGAARRRDLLLDSASRTRAEHP